MTDLFSSINDIPYHHSPRSCVFKTKQVSLYHYESTSIENAVPLLLVFATVNRPEILDIFPDRSLIKGLIAKNQDLYLLDWGYPTPSDRETSFEDYIKWLDRCVKHIRKTSSHPTINLLGICQGGVISLCYTALSKYIQNLILISTPVDFHTEDHVVSQLLNKIDISLLTNRVGNVPGALLTDFFISLRPFELIGKKYLHLLERQEDTQFTDRFWRVEKWLRDAPDQPGKAFSEFVEQCYQQNRLCHGSWKLNNKQINLANITIPILNIMAEKDEIVPMSASKPLPQYVSSKDYTALCFPSGHIGIYVSDKVGAHLYHAISDWLTTRNKTYSGTR